MNSETAWGRRPKHPRRFQEVRSMDETITRPSMHPTVPYTSPPDSLVNAPAFTRLCRRNRARFLFGLLRLRRGLDPTNPFDAELLDAVDVETDRLSHLMRGCRP